MKNNTTTPTRQSGQRKKLEADVLAAYNIQRKKNPQPSPTECYTAVGLQMGMLIYQVQYIIIKARKAGKKVL